jgi:hypothetical protein
MKRHAQIIGQVFVFILAGLVFVLILAYGYRAVTHFLERGEEVQLLDFRNALDSTITTIKRDYGSVQRVDLRVPAKTEEVCFVSTSPEDITSDQQQDLQQQHPLLFSAWSTGSENVFLIPRQPTPLLITDLLVDTGYVCVPAVSGRVSLRVEGTGSKARLSPWRS